MGSVLGTLLIARNVAMKRMYRNPALIELGYSRKVNICFRILSFLYMVNIGNFFLLKRSLIEKLIGGLTGWSSG